MNAKKTILRLSLLLVALAPLSQAQASGTAQAGPAGGSGGSPFRALCATGKLVGLNVYSGWFVDSVQMICDNGFGTAEAEGVHFGGGGGGWKQLKCRDGYVVSGIHGRDGRFVDRVGITCSSMDDPTSSYNVGSVGGGGGSYFSFNCPNGSYASGIFGRAANLVDQLGLHCKVPRTDLSCDPWGDDCGIGEYCQLGAEDQCGDGWTEGTCKSVRVVCPAVQAPVCGCDGITYNNRCYAQQAGQNVWQDGEC